MSHGTVEDWNPGTYGRFRGLRLRPAIDLLAQVPALPDGTVVDLGCGSGAAGPALRARYPERELLGVDLSPAMLAEAGQTGAYDRLSEADAAQWRPGTPAALIFSNAALHWLGDHSALLPRLAGALAPGGTLAVQMPRQFGAPSHTALREIALGYPALRDLAGAPVPVGPPQDYHRLLAPLGAVTVWETDYIQSLPPAAKGHPVRAFTESTAMRPYLSPLSEVERQTFTAAYDEALAKAYPREADGSVLMPFRRLFFVLTV